MIEAVLAEVLGAAVARMGRQLETRMRKTEDGKRAIAKQAIDAASYKRSLLRAKMPAPDGATADEIEQVIRSAEIAAVVFEVLTLTLLASPDYSLERPRSWWVQAFSERTPGLQKEWVNGLFDMICEQQSIGVNVVKEQMPDAYAIIRKDAESGRIACILESIERKLSNPNWRGTLTAPHETLIRTYRKQLQRAHGQIELPDFERRRKLPIEDVYVSPSIFRDDPKESIAITENIDRTVLLGDPGHGKTTCSQVLVHRLAQDPAAPVPFLITLRNFTSQTRNSQSIIDYIETQAREYYQCEMPKEVTQTLLETGQALVVFDGLDELLDTSRRRTVTDIVSLFCNRYPYARILITSRRVGYQQAPMDPAQFDVLQLDGFKRNEVEEYVRRWFRTDTSLVKSEDAWTQAFMRESKSIPDLTSAPLILALMCIIYRGERSLPRNRPAVYEKCADLLFNKWDSSREINIELTAGQLVDPAMKHLAYWMFTREDQDDGVKESELIAETRKYLLERSFDSELDATAAARQFIKFCSGRAWVFTDVGTTADGEKLFKFTHRTFLEYFTAYQISRTLDSPERIAQEILDRVAASEWDVVSQLVVQISDKHSDRGAGRIFAYLLDNAGPLKRHNVIGFLCRCLEFAQIPPRMLRRMVREVIETDRPIEPTTIANTFIGDAAKFKPTSDPLLLLTGNLQHLDGDVVRSAFEERLDDLFESDSVDDLVAALEICIDLQYAPGIGLLDKPSSNDRQSWIEAFIMKHRQAFVESWPISEQAWYYAIEKGWLSLYNAIQLRCASSVDVCDLTWAFRVGREKSLAYAQARIIIDAPCSAALNMLLVSENIFGSNSDEFTPVLKRLLEDLGEIVVNDPRKLIVDRAEFIGIRKGSGFNNREYFKQIDSLTIGQHAAIVFIFAVAYESERNLSFATLRNTLPPTLLSYFNGRSRGVGQMAERPLALNVDRLRRWAAGDLSFCPRSDLESLKKQSPRLAM